MFLRRYAKVLQFRFSNQDTGNQSELFQSFLKKNENSESQYTPKNIVEYLDQFVIGQR